MFSRLIEKYYWLFFALGMALGWFVPQATGFLSPYILHMLVIVLFLTMLKMDAKDVFSHFKNPFLIVCLSLLILIVSPIAFYYFSGLFLPPNYSLAILLLAAMPAGMSITAYAGIFKGSASLALTLTMATSLLAPFTVPAVIYFLTGNSLQINVFEMIASLSGIIFLPFLLSLIFRKFAAKQINRMEKYFKPAVIILITLIMAASIAKISGKHLELDSLWLVVLLLFFLAAALHIIGYYAAFLQGKADRISSSLAVAYMNSTLAIVLASSFFGPETLLAVVLYQFPTNIMLILFGWIVGRNQQK
ncbi:MAG: bile acid:sodium symporter [Nanoarchaeota archaeon]|nr:bile acid:sodium symporter [Nanoarchaeota archaeon]